MDALAPAILLAVLVKSLLDFIAKPIQTKWPQYDLWYFDWVALVIGAILAWFARVDILTSYLATAPAWLTRLLTALVIGGGANLINDIFTLMQGQVLVARTTSISSLEDDTLATNTVERGPRRVGW